MTNPIELHESVEIERPADEVWAVLADYDHDPEWRAGVATMAPVPAGVVQVGTRTAEELRFAGRTWHNDGVVDVVAPGERFVWRTTSGADARGSRTVERLDDGRCRVHLHLVVRPHGAERMMKPLLAVMLRRNLRGDAQRLRHLLTSGKVARPGAG